MKIVGFTNVVSRKGNKGVKVCVSGDWSKWDKENGDPKGKKCEMWYVSGIHLEESDIGKSVKFVFGTYEGRVYIKRMEVDDVVYK